MKKLQILDKEFNILNIKLIESDSKMIIVEEKPKGLIILISENITKNINEFKGFEIIRENDDRYIELIGLETKLKIDIVTKLNISKQLLYIEEINNNKFRLTFSKALISEIKEINKLNIL